MIVNDSKKDKKGYLVTIDNKDYIIDEEIVIKYRLVKNKELEDNLLNKILHDNNMIIYYKKALNYSLKYNKNSAAIYDYLNKFEINNRDIAEIIDNLIKIHVLDDEKLILNTLDTLIRKGNGKLLIKEKLYNLKYREELINLALTRINYDDYFASLKKLYDKALIKYDKETDSYIKNMKIKKYLYQRGYSLDDINTIKD
ncbi:MAG: RecX family transcriptional regulator [Acholeplasmatales bacterium]|nr:RecX family transcriptional regulator [Acholeplasmatales bacterium]